jgi:hypothetical protein
LRPARRVPAPGGTSRSNRPRTLPTGRRPIDRDPATAGDICRRPRPDRQPLDRTYRTETAREVPVMVPGGATEALGLDAGRGRRALSSAERASYSRVSGPDPESRDQTRGGRTSRYEETRAIGDEHPRGRSGKVRSRALYGERRKAKRTNQRRQCGCRDGRTCTASSGRLSTWEEGPGSVTR